MKHVRIFLLVITVLASCTPASSESEAATHAIETFVAQFTDTPAPPKATSTAAAPQTQRPPITNDFEGGITQGIALRSGTWQVLDDGTKNHVLQLQNKSLNIWPGFSIGSTITDGIIQYRMKYLDYDPSSDTGSGRVTLFFRGKFESDAYAFSLVPYWNRTEVCYVGGDGDWSSPIAGSINTVFFEKDVWYTVRLELNGSIISAYLNGTPVSTLVDNRFQAGNVVLQTGPNMQVQFDDISVVYSAP